MIEAILMLGGLGIVVGSGLALASKVFYVYVDPKVLEVESVLPGANCGGCGLPGCGANAEAIVAGKASPNSCVAAGPEVAEAIAAALGVTIEAKEPDVARPGCYFGVGDADVKFIYDGVSDCRAAAALSGGMKVCNIGCLGLGSCVQACPFDALSMGPDGLPVVDEVKCTGCGTCERVCPKHIITLSSVTRRILREYTVDQCTTPCQRRCPAGIDIREYIREISRGDYIRSVQVIKERNPFPTVIGRICPRPCEEDCRRGMVDEPVAINYLKRFVADFEREGGERILPYKAPATGRKVAVVGGGVQGLSVAFFSARLGHGAVVYEATDRLGGLLRTAIARERLPGEILDWDIDGILEMGVEARTGQTLGVDFTMASLLAEGHEAVFLASGGWDSRLTRMSGDEIQETIPGTYLLIDLIKSDSARHNRLDIHTNVVIDGGGKLGLQAARICADLGSQGVTVLFREGEDALIDTDEAREMVADLEADGVRIIHGADVTAFYGEGDRLTTVEYLDIGSGEHRAVPAENLFIAAGRLPELIFVEDKPEDTPGDEGAEAAESVAAAAEAPLRWKAIAPYKPPELADAEGLLSEGNALTDFSAAIRAIGAGRRAAASVHELMYGISLALPDTVVRSEKVLQDVDHVERVETDPRRIMPLCTRPDCREVELGFDEATAQAEANRCLQCGLVCYERSETAPADGATGHTLENTAGLRTSSAA